MDWLQKMIDDSKAKRAAKNKFSSVLPRTTTATTSAFISENPVIKEDITVANNEILEERTADIAMKESTTTTTTPASKTQTNSFLFKKTLIGYQGHENPQSSPILAKSLKSQIPKLKTSDDTIKGTREDLMFSDEAYITPVKKTGLLPLYTKGSEIKSILKTKPTTFKIERTPMTQKASSIHNPTSVHNSQVKANARSNVNSTVTPSQQALKLAGTPVRLSAYARQQLKMGLPLPKENRYERFGESVTGPSFEGAAANSTANKNENPNNTTSKTATGKSVRWAETLEKKYEVNKEVCADLFLFVWLPNVSFSCFCCC